MRYSAIEMTKRIIKTETKQKIPYSINIKI